jgi:ribosomal protein S18 acetylase RimI-like enzyme
MYSFEYADKYSFETLKKYDKHISEEMLYKKIKDKEVIIVKTADKIIGWLRFGYFWDNIPFMNMLVIDENYRGKGIGKELVTFWEKEMKDNGYESVMTSTLSNEMAQHFYRKLGYEDSGSLILEKEALEIIFTKKL